MTTGYIDISTFWHSAFWYSCGEDLSWHSLSQSISSSLLQLQATMLFHLSIASMNSLHSTGRSLETLHLLWLSPWSLFESSGRNHQSFLAVTLWTYWALFLWCLSPFLSHVASGGDHSLHQKVFSHFGILGFRMSLIPIVRHLDSPSCDLWNGV